MWQKQRLFIERIFLIVEEGQKLGKVRDSNSLHLLWVLSTASPLPTSSYSSWQALFLTCTPGTERFLDIFSAANPCSSQCPSLPTLFCHSGKEGSLDVVALGLGLWDREEEGSSKSWRKKLGPVGISLFKSPSLLP